MSKSSRKRRISHPFLCLGNKSAFHKKDPASIGLNSVNMTRHHLYPKDRKDVDILKENFILKLWAHKHFFGWNSLFQFDYKKEECGVLLRTELTIDEIITCMICRHPIITQKIGTPAWRLIFRDKDIEEAINLLCRMLSIKFNRKPAIILNEKINFAVIKIAA